LDDSAQMLISALGTVKSFLGSFLVKTILSQTNLKVLVISFKNHALDDFLEGLLDLGIGADVMVRLGSKTKSTLKTAPLLLSQRQHPRKADTWAMINALEPEAEARSQELQKSFVNFDTASVSWNEIHEYLEFSKDDQQFHDAFTVPEELYG
jgi:hypothetical protein